MTFAERKCRQLSIPGEGPSVCPQSASMVSSVAEANMEGFLSLDSLERCGQMSEGITIQA